MKEFQVSQKVKYVRVQHKDAKNKNTVLVWGKGLIVSKFIDVNRRIRYMVKDGEHTWNLEPIAIDPTKDEANAYFKHYLAVQEVVDKHNKDAAAEIARVNKVIDAMHDGFFGLPIIPDDKAA